MTTLRFSGDVSVSADALALIAAAVGVLTTDIRVFVGDDQGDDGMADLAAGGWLYDRPDEEAASGEARLGAGVSGWSVGSRWAGEVVR